MIAIICGGRDYADRNRVRAILDASISRLGVSAVITDDASPCGAMADEWASEHEFQRIRMKDFTGTPEHNRLMLDVSLGWKDRVMFAFPGADANMVAQAKGAGIRVVEIDKN